jgi:hypothetical protein
MCVTVRTNLVDTKLYFHHGNDCIYSKSFVSCRRYLLPESLFQRPYPICITKHLTWFAIENHRSNQFMTQHVCCTFSGNNYSCIILICEGEHKVVCEL